MLWSAASCLLHALASLVLEDEGGPLLLDQVLAEPGQPGEARSLPLKSQLTSLTGHA